MRNISLFYGKIRFLTILLFLFFGYARAAGPVSTLASAPDWSDLAPFQKTITRAEFVRLLDTVYAPGGGWKSCIDIGPAFARIHQPGSQAADFVLEFASSPETARPVPRYWRTPGQSLAGVRIALDPGHLGGRWAKMEERWFQIGNSKPVTEGDMALLAARHLAARLESMGAQVLWVRQTAEPLTSARPDKLRNAARAELRAAGIRNPRAKYNGPNDPHKTATIQWQSELLFYRISEIRARARRVNEQLRPDLVICLHFNAEEWGDPAHPALTDKNHLHMLINGNYGRGELGLADVRHEMLLQLLNRCAPTDLAVNARVGESLARATGLPPYVYHGRARSTSSPYVWTRNLLATRLYRCPVVYCEPYVMNSKEIFERVQMGDYAGLRPVGGTMRKSLYREYADAVADGVAAYYGNRR